MKHIAFAVVAAAALAVIGPHLSQENSQSKEMAAQHALSIPPGYHATLPRSHTGASRNIQ